jgi:predicted ATP-dependent endonuclease of OLD family
MKKYKSMLDFKSEFRPNLNIIIGKNFTGKVNILKYLYDFLKLESRDNNLDFYPTLINSNIPSSYPVVNDRFLIDAHSWYLSLILNEYTNNSDLSSFCKYITYIISQSQMPLNDFIDVSKKQIKEHIINYVDDNLSTLKRELRITEIQDLRLKNDFKIVKSYILKNLKTEQKELDIMEDDIMNDRPVTVFSEKGNFFLIENMIFEFKIRGKWLNFDMLCFETQKLFYIISEIVSFNMQNKNKIFLLEEPEIGLHLLSLFLKEQSKKNKIILTTNSPQLLNILDPNELKGLIISYSKKGQTDLRHLSKQQENKANGYMQEIGFLSDYWLHSDLEVTL